MYKRILVPVDGSDTSNTALTTALQLARESGGSVRLLHALDELAYLPGFEFRGNVIEIARDNAAKVLAGGVELAKAAGIPADTRLIEAPGRRDGEVVADEASAFQADLIVVGTHGRRGLSRVLLGSGAEQVNRMAPVPVLTVRGTTKD